MTLENRITIFLNFFVQSSRHFYSSYFVTKSLSLTSNKGQKRPKKVVLAGYATLFTDGNRRLFELLPDITGLCRTSQNDGNYKARRMALYKSNVYQPSECHLFLNILVTLSRSSTRSSPPSKSSFVPSSAFSLRLVMYLSRTI